MGGEEHIIYSLSDCCKENLLHAERQEPPVAYIDLHRWCGGGESVQLKRDLSSKRKATELLPIQA